jgi:hypothetical protein
MKAKLSIDLKKNCIYHFSHYSGSAITESYVFKMFKLRILEKASRFMIGGLETIFYR